MAVGPAHTVAHVAFGVPRKTYYCAHQAYSFIDFAKAHLNAIASTEWEGFTVVILNKSIQIFNRANIDEGPHSGDALTAISSFILGFDAEGDGDRDFVEEATFEVGTNRRSQSGAPLLLFSGRRRDLFSFTGALTLERGGGGQRKPRLVGVWTAEYYITDGDVDDEDKSELFPKLPIAVRTKVGHSFGYVLQVVQSGESEDRPLELLILSWSKQTFKRFGEQHLSSLIVPSKVDGSGLPLLQFLTCVDFDDAAGLIVAGTSRGDLCLVRFLSETSWAAGALQTSLPKLRNSVPNVSKVRNGTGTVYLSDTQPPSAFSVQ